VEEFRKATMKPVPAGSILTISTAGGGGYGLAAEREAESVLIDVTRGLVSVGLAAASYGVVVVETPNGLEIDTSATELLRQDIRQADIRHK
jgi:N-methylhydantoinase B